jgi:AsmA protein
MKWLKRLLLVFGVLVLLVVGGVAVFVATFDPNSYKGRIEEMVKAKTGRTLTLAGDMHLAIYPRLGLRLNDVSLSNPPGFGEQPFARIGQASLYVELLPLLQRRLVVDKVVIDGLDLALERNAKGVANWAGLGGAAGGKAAGSVSQKAESSPAAAAAGAPFALAVAGVEIRKARVSWTDRVDGSHVVLAPLDLSVGRLAPGQSAPLKLSFHVENAKPAVGVDATMTAQLSADLEKGSYALKNIVFKADAKGDSLPQGELKAALSGDLAVSEAKGGQIRFAPFKVSVNDTQADGSLSLSGFANPAIQFKLHSPSLNLDHLLATMGGAAESGKAPAAGGNASAKPAMNGNTPIPLPVAALRKLHVDGEISVDHLVAQKLKLSAVQAVLKARNGLLQLAPVSASLYGGGFKANASLNVRGARPQYAVDANLQQVQIGDLLKDYAGDAYMTGVAKMSAKLGTTGRTVNALTRALAGQLAFSVTDGAFQRSQLADRIQTLMAALQQTKPGEWKDNRFASLTATAQVRSGVIYNRDLLLNAVKFKATGSGTADLVKRQVDYVLSFAKAQGKGAVIPLQIKGPFDALSYNVDLASVAREAAKAQLQKELDKQREKLEQDLQKNLPKSLKGLF